jgi:hypothetical protein
MQTPLARWLTVVLAAIYTVLGSLEVILRVDDADPNYGAMAFLGGTLLGGAAIIVVGLLAPLPEKYRVPVIMVGLVAGLTATLWTVVVPILAIVIVVLTVRGDGSDRVAAPD